MNGVDSIKYAIRHMSMVLTIIIFWYGLSMRQIIGI